MIQPFWRYISTSNSRCPSLLIPGPATAPSVRILHQPCAPPSLSPPPLSCYSRVKSGQVSQFCERECGELRRVRESRGALWRAALLARCQDCCPSPRGEYRHWPVMYLASQRVILAVPCTGHLSCQLVTTTVPPSLLNFVFHSISISITLVRVRR